MTLHVTTSEAPRTLADLAGVVYPTVGSSAAILRVVPRAGWRVVTARRRSRADVEAAVARRLGQAGR